MVGGYKAFDLITFAWSIRRQMQTLFGTPGAQ
jgi:hypothetical protein